MRLRLYSLTTLLILTVGCALQAVSEPHRVDPANEPTPLPTAVEIARPTYTVQQGDVIREIRLSGQVVPINEINLAFEQAGVVNEIFFGQGDSVSEGDVIATLDVSDLQNDLVLAENSLAVAEGRLAAIEAQIANDRRRAEIAVEQAKLLLDLAVLEADDPPNPTQAVNIQMKELDIELAELTLSELNAAIDPGLEADIAQATLQIEAIEAEIAKAQIVAPTDGTILRLNIRAGVSADPNQVALILADLSILEIRALVFDEDLPLVTLDMSGIAQLAARPGDPYDAILNELPFNAGGTGEEESIVRFRIPAEGAFEVNDRVTIDLVVAEQSDVLWLPPQAIREFSGRKFVVVQEGAGQRRVDVKTGLENDDQVEILSGLELDAVVVGQ